MQISGTLIAWPSEIASHPELINQTRVLMLVMIINICITFPTYIFESNIMVREQFILLRAITILRQICNPLLSLPLLFLGFGNMSLSLATMAVTMTTSVIYIVYCFKVLKIRFKFYIPRLADLREIFGFSFFVMINLIVDQINWSLDRILLGSLVSASAVTIYSLADQLSRYFFNFSSTISDVFTPKIHRIVASGSDDWELTRLFTQVARIQFMVLSLIIFGFFGVGEYFSSLYGAASENYHEVYRVTMILFFAGAHSGHSVYGHSDSAGQKHASLQGICESGHCAFQCDLFDPPKSDVGAYRSCFGHADHELCWETWY